MTVIGGVAALAATSATAQETGVFREADAAMTCAQIGDEAAQLSAAMGDATPQGGWLSSLGGMARQGATLLVPGGALAVAGVDAVRQPGRERNEAEQKAAQDRWYYLNGLHAGRGCREPAEVVEVEAPVVAAPVAPAPAIRPVAMANPVRSGR